MANSTATGEAGGGYSSERDDESSSDDQIIDVVSHGPATLHSTRANFVIDEDDGRGIINGSRRSVGSKDVDEERQEEEEEGEEEEEEEEEYAQEHEYRRGRHAVPMRSPGEELADVDLLEDTRDSARSLPRLPKLRNRVFFQNDDISIGLGGDRPSRRVLFRRRKRQEGDVFWTAIFVSNLLSLAVLSCLVIYLSQTDFFASHQNDLFGTTVDNRFTVVSQQDSRAAIYLKSGMSMRITHTHILLPPCP